MAPSTAKKFIDAALYSAGPHALSYTHHDHKRIIRDHLLSLLADFPSLSPSTDRFVHNDGTSVHLLNVSGCLPVSANPHPIHLTIWVHQFYPFVPPLIFLTTSPTYSILRGHPFVDTSGAASSPYLQTWQYPRSNLSDLTRNLVHIFTHHPPFSDFSSTSYHSRPSLPSKREAIDRLVGILYYDLTSLRTQVENETEDLLSLQVTLKKRTQITVTMIKELEEEKSSLKERVKQVMEKVDVLQIWSKENGCGLTSSFTQDACEKFEAEDEKSRQILENEAADRAIEDAIEVLDKEAQNGSVSCGAYIRQIRTLAREQFFHRAMRVKLHNSVLYPP
ncbi:protein ELC-like [Aristolochia californica]|uniref:protein ELC-like n=1 Tax=Aristolochia californica TaxID=171875 RepID=UPI0035E2D9E2